MSIDRGMDKEDALYLYKRILLSHKKKNEIMSLAAKRKDLEITRLIEVSQTEVSVKKRKLKKGYKWTYMQNRNRLTDIENKVMINKGESEGGIN